MNHDRFGLRRASAWAFNASVERVMSPRWLASGSRGMEPHVVSFGYCMGE